MNTRRAYSMEVRGRRAEETRQRILEAARRQFDAHASDFTLDSVALAAGTTVQTVLRAFGNKASLILAAIGTFRGRPADFAVPTSPTEAVAQVFDDYEEIGDRVIRLLADEQRVAGFAEVARQGREHHRSWVEAAFADELGRQPVEVRAEVVAALVAATDVYVWKLLRRDQGLDRAAAEHVVRRLVEGAVER